MRQSTPPVRFGEINVGRDFECFADGAALVKPDMSHLVTCSRRKETVPTNAPASLRVAGTNLSRPNKP